MLYARAIALRNCGRFTVVASDFGSDYRTHTHVSSEALYAGLTRGISWRPRVIDLKNDPSTFTLSYNVAAMPLWFLPGLFLTNGSYRLPDTELDTTAFNVVSEFCPSTSRRYVFKKGMLEERDRPYHVPTYGTIQAIKPNRRLVTYAFSPKQELLEGFAEGQTFLLGKKRTMFQILLLSDIVEGKQAKGECVTSWLQLPSEYGKYFKQFEISVVTMRYVIVRGVTKDPGEYVEFCFENSNLCLPDFYLRVIPLFTV